MRKLVFLIVFVVGCGPLPVDVPPPTPSDMPPPAPQQQIEPSPNDILAPPPREKDEEEFVAHPPVFDRKKKEG